MRCVAKVGVVAVIALLGSTVAPTLTVGAEPAVAHVPTGQPLTVGKLRATFDDPSAMDGDDFGLAVAQSGSNVIVGAPGSSISANAAAYIYTKGPSGWPATPTVTLPDPGGTGGYFGNAVAISGDTAIVAAYGTGDSMYVGTAYIYVRGASGWPAIPTVTLNNPNPTFYDFFGWSVAVSGNTAVVGAMNSTGVGSAYIYTKGALAWPSKPTVILGDPNGSYVDQFGYSVSISGNTVIVGAPDSTSKQAYAGKAYLYVKGSSGWPISPTKILRDPDGMKYDQFGNAVAVSNTTAVVGAYAAHEQEGAAYVFLEGPSGWNGTPTTTLADPGATDYDNFGNAVALSGSVAVIGEIGVNSLDVKAYIFDKGPTGWPAKPTATLSDPAGSGDDAFGWGVASSTHDVAVGAEFTGYRGATYIFAAG